jgi:hypothetical protein
VAASATFLDILIGPFIDGVDKMYHQLKDILSIITILQAESFLQH